MREKPNKRPAKAAIEIRIHSVQGFAGVLNQKSFRHSDGGWRNDRNTIRLTP
jgi:hypothetical protein